MYYLISWMKLNWETVFIFAVPIIYGIIPIAINHEAARCGYVILVVATFWVTEVLPLPVSSMIPVFAFPLLGILSTNDTCIVYMKSTNMMFLGGLAVAIAIEHCNLHQRIALLVILKLGQSPRRLMSGFMLTTMFLSMWISNTASTAMMIPVVEAIIFELQMSNDKYKDSARASTDTFDLLEVVMDDKDQERHRIRPSKKINKQEKSQDHEDKGNMLDINSDKPVQLDAAHQQLQDMCFLATAYSANIGGTGSLPGTGPNLVLKEILDSSFSEPSGLNFATWMFFNVPGMIICVFLAWIWLQILYMGLCRKGSSTIQKSTPESEMAIKRLLLTRYHNLGPIKQHEITIFGAFIVLVFLWFFRAPGFMTGWADVISRNFGNNVKIGGATPAIFITFMLFVLPKKWNSPFNKDILNKLHCGPSPPCITWEVIQSKMHWNLMLLIGGGFALAKGAKQSGLSEWLGLQLVGLQVMPKEAIVFVISLIISLGTEVASNIATASMLLPVLKEMGLNMRVNPLYLMLPAAICCSYAFMLPVATAPNAIAFNAGKIKSKDMMKAGIVMNFICVIVITIMINTMGVAMFDLHNMPAWTNSTIIEEGF